MVFAKRTDWPSSPNQLARKLEEKKRSGAGVIDLTESNPTRCSLRSARNGFLAALGHPENAYYHPDPRGLASARKAVCGYYAEKGIRVSPDQIFLTSGTSEAYSFVFRLMADPGDAVLAFKPSYPLLDYLADLNDASLRRTPLVYEAGWSLEGGSFERAMREKPKVLAVVNPNNPTGNFVSAPERERMVSMSRQCGAAILSDEVFLDFAFDAQDGAESFASNQESLTFTLSGVSKLLGLPQMKVSWIVVSGPRDSAERAKERLETLSDTYLSVNTPSQRALGAWLGERTAVLSEIRSRLLQNRSYLAESLKTGSAAELLKAAGGWYAVLKVRSGEAEEKLALRLLEEHNILVHPGYYFEFEGGTFLVVSLLSEEALFQKGIDRLAEALA